MSRWIMIGLICCAVLLMAAPSQAADQPEEKEKLITIDFTNAPLSSVLDAIFELAGESYTLDSNVNDVNVTMHLESVTFDQAMRALLKCSGVAYTLNGRIYQIGARPDSSDPEVKSERTVIRLQYVPGADVAPFIADTPGILNVAVTNGNALVHEGDPEAIEAAQEMMELLDDPSYLPRQVEITLDVAVVAASGEPGTPGSGTLRASQTVSVAEGLPITLVLSSAPSGTGKASQANESLNLTITLTPAVSGYSGYAGNGSDDGNTMVTLSAHAVLTATLNGIQVRREFNPALAVKPGITATVLIGTSEDSGGGLTLQITAKVEVLGWLKLSRDPRATGATITAPPATRRGGSGEPVRSPSSIDPYVGASIGSPE